MSLEAKIEALTKAVETLTAAMEKGPIAAQPTIGAEPAERPASVESKPEPEQPGREGLQDLCMTIVRNDRGKRNVVKEAIASFGGAETLKDVPEKDLAALKAKLEAI